MRALWYAPENEVSFADLTLALLAAADDSLAGTGSLVAILQERGLMGGGESNIDPRRQRSAPVLASLSPTMADQDAVMRYLSRFDVNAEADLYSDVRARDGQRLLQVRHVEQRLLDNVGDGLMPRLPGWRCNGESCSQR